MIFGGMVRIVRVGNDQQLATFRRLLRQYQEELPEDLRVLHLDAEIAGLTDRYAAGAMLMAEREDGSPVGCVVLHRSSDEDAEIKRLWVDPTARGLGAGRALVQAVIDLARMGGYRRVILDTHAGRLVAAYNLYRSMGFTECEPYGDADYACPTFLALPLHEEPATS